MPSLLPKKVRDFVGFVFYVVGGIFGPFMIASYPLLLYSGHYLTCLAYGLWWLYDFETPESGGRAFECLRTLTPWYYVRDYFPIKLIKTAELPPDRNYLMLCHPHGVLGFGSVVNCVTDVTGFRQLYPGLRSTIAGFKLLLRIPFFREYIMSFNILAASKKSLDHLLSRAGGGQAVALVVGGTRELLEAHPGSTTLVLNRRKGAIKIALRNGASLVPVYSFGENEIFVQWHSCSATFKQWQMALINLIGFPWLLLRNFYPRRHPINTVVGSPIHVSKTADPSQAQIDQLHARYKSALIELFEAHKLQYGLAPGQHLEFL